MAAGMYTASVCDKLEQSGMGDEWEEIAEDQDSAASSNLNHVSNVSGTDRYDGTYVETSRHRQSGVADILVTGHVSIYFTTCLRHWDLPPAFC
jgi:hypothetical protein